MKYQNILNALPYAAPFLFVDSLSHVDDTSVKGSFTFKESLPFYQGHFKNFPITPGVILTECCAQIGLICMGLGVLNKSNTLSIDSAVNIAMSSSNMEFYHPVYPNETVNVISEKIYFRFHKLKCKVQMFNSKGVLVCKGTIAGMMKNIDNG